MTDLVFVDTNVLIYRVDHADPEKQRRAESWLGTLWSGHNGRLSFQVLQEFYTTATRKLDPALDREAARTIVRSLLAWQPVPVDARVVEGAWAVEERYGLSWWDALIVSAAQVADCRYLLTEDLQSGQDLGQVEVVDPFARAAEEIFG